jgi:hypothetical protein
MGHYLTDLVVSIAIVLIFGWIIQASTDDRYMEEALTTQSAIYVAISHLTPLNMFAEYAATVGAMKRSFDASFNLADGLLVDAGHTFATIGWLLLDIFLAAPLTMIQLYRETSGMAALIVLAGFIVAIGAVFAWLLTGKFAPWRLLLASVASPLVVSVVFLLLQGFMLVLLGAFFRFTVLAPYAVACPVICTLYWIAFPHADHGATSAVIRAIGHLLPRR